MLIMLLLLFLNTNDPIQVTANGVITQDESQKNFYMSAQIKNINQNTITHLRITHPDSENIDLILTNGNIYDRNLTELKQSSILAKLIHLGVLDPLLILEILSGNRAELYNSFMTTGPDNTINFTLLPKDISLLCEQWTDSPIIKQVVTSLQAKVEYTFNIQNQILTVNIKSENSAPNLRCTYGTVTAKQLTPIQPQAQLPSS